VHSPPGEGWVRDEGGQMKEIHMRNYHRGTHKEEGHSRGGGQRKEQGGETPTVIGCRGKEPEHKGVSLRQVVRKKSNFKRVKKNPQKRKRGALLHQGE